MRSIIPDNQLQKKQIIVERKTMNDGRKKKPQKHQNKKAFKLVFQPHAEKTHQKVSLDNLCKRCLEQMQWKIQFNKYKKMTQPSRCNFCQQKSVFRSYMKACQICIKEKNACAKCLDIDYQVPQNIPQNKKQRNQQDKQTQRQMNAFIKTLRERSRRTIKRGYEKGKFDWNRQLQYFVDKNGQKVIGLAFRNQGGDDEEDKEGNIQQSDFDSEQQKSFQDDEESQEKSQKEKKVQNEQKDCQSNQNSDQKPQNQELIIQKQIDSCK